MGDYTYSGILYFFMIVGFICMWVWAWSSKRKPDFDEMSRLPLEEDDDQLQSTKHDHSKHG